MKKSDEAKQPTPEVVTDVDQKSVEFVLKIVPLHRALTYYSPEQIAEALKKLPPGYIQ